MKRKPTIYYCKALEQADNPKSRVELFPKTDHGIVVSENGCPDEGQLLEYVKTLGFKSISEAQEAVLKDPYKPGLLSTFPFAPGYLDTMGKWLRDLRQ